MLYVGLDIHRNHITGFVLEGNRKVKERWQVGDVEQLMSRSVRHRKRMACNRLQAIDIK